VVLGFAVEENSLQEILAGTVADFLANNDRRIIMVGNLEIAVLHRGGSFFAYHNQCVHQGGPAGEGLIMAKVEDVFGPDRTQVGQRFSDSEFHFVCPWHGFEYKLDSGECVPDRFKKLRKFNVVRKGDDIYVVV
jgi:nitrite reductase (NADH) small subunit